MERKEKKRGRSRRKGGEGGEIEGKRGKGEGEGGGRKAALCPLERACQLCPSPAAIHWLLCVISGQK